MTLHAVAVPKWGLAMEEGTLTGWLVAEGATVAAGVEIAEIETSKIANVLEASASGVFRRRVAKEGDVKQVGALLGVIADGDEDDATIDLFVQGYEERFESGALAGPSAPEPEIVSVGGLPIRYLKLAAASETPGAPMVLIHGFGGDHLNWMFNQEALSADRDVYAIDLPGHGGSTKDAGAGTLAALAATVSTWIDQLELGPVHLVGHSMGAGVALTVALSRAGQVRSLTSLCGAGFGGTLSRDYVEGFAAAQKRKDLQPVASLLFANPNLVTREMLDDLMSYKRIDGVDAVLRLLIDNALSDAVLADLTTARAGVAAPTLTIFGAADQIMRTPDVLPAEAVVIGGAGHMPHLEAAQDINDRIAAFAAAHD